MGLPLDTATPRLKTRVTVLSSPRLMAAAALGAGPGCTPMLIGGEEGDLSCVANRGIQVFNVR